MIPPFGFHKIERLGCLLMGVAGMIALGIAFSVEGGRREAFLVLQSLAIIVGAVGARNNSFILAAIGIVSSLLAWTPVGRVSFIPGLLMLFLIMARFRAFSIFTPRWPGPGPPPPG
jgi:hypothetical protein